jgi:ribose 1,5-bisphosphokinase PhnN
MNLLLSTIILLVLVLVWYAPLLGMRLHQKSREHLEELDEKLVRYLPYAAAYYPTTTGIVYRQM